MCNPLPRYLQLAAEHDAGACERLQQRWSHPPPHRSHQQQHGTLQDTNG